MHVHVGTIASTEVGNRQLAKAKCVQQQYKGNKQHLSLLTMFSLVIGLGGVFEPIVGSDL